MRLLILPLLKNLLFFLVILIFASTHIAQASIQDNKIEKKSIKEKNKVDIINDLLPTSCLFSANFDQQKKTKEFPFPLTSSGQLFFNCKQGLIWTNIKPFREDTIYTSPGIHFRLVPNEPIQQLEGSRHSYFASLLLGILSADISAIENKFKVSITQNGANANHSDINNRTSIKLTPKNKNIEKRLNSIYINKHEVNDKETITIKINSQNHQTTILSIDKIKDLLLSDTEFKNIDQQCLTHINKIETYQNACAILKNPQKHISFKTNN